LHAAAASPQAAAHGLSNCSSRSPMIGRGSWPRRHTCANSFTTAAEGTAPRLPPGAIYGLICAAQGRIQARELMEWERCACRR
jgi:hypothetical protein